MTAARATPGLHPRLRPIVGALGATLLATIGFAQFDSPRPFLSDSERSVPLALPVPIYFPINPPPLDRAVSRLSASGSTHTFAPPPELALYVTEPFYAPLGTRLIQKSLDEKKRGQIEAYRVARETLLEELHAELARVRDAEPAERRQALGALARRQTPRLVELEAAAERIRSDFASADNDWSALREWRLGERNLRADSPTELASVMRAAAFYQPGLSLAQRQLLREIVIEITTGAEDAAAAAARQPFLFFSPALTRVMLPDNLPAEVARKIAVFETKKSALKKELFDVLLAEDRAVFGFIRTAAVKSLATRQAPALAAIEQLADEIRDGLAAVPAMTPPETRSPLPPTLTQRTMVVVEARTALQKTTRAKIDAIAGELPSDYPVIVVTTIDAQGVKVRFAPRPGSRRRLVPNDPVMTGIVARLNEVGEAHRLRYEELNQTVEALRGDVGRVLGAGATRPQIDQALDGVIRFNVQRENEDGYRDYRLAVFEPGLSPEQRRLLLGSALRKLDLPLPEGELQPTRRPNAW